MEMTKKEAIAVANALINSENTLTVTQEQAIITLVNSCEKTLIQQENQRAKDKMYKDAGRAALAAKKAELI